MAIGIVAEGYEESEREDYSCKYRPCRFVSTSVVVVAHCIPAAATRGMPESTISVSSISPMSPVPVVEPTAIPTTLTTSAISNKNFMAYAPHVTLLKELVAGRHPMADKSARLRLVDYVLRSGGEDLPSGSTWPKLIYLSRIVTSHRCKPMSSHARRFTGKLVV